MRGRWTPARFWVDGRLAGAEPRGGVCAGGEEGAGREGDRGWTTSCVVRGEAGTRGGAEFAFVKFFSGADSCSGGRSSVKRRVDIPCPSLITDLTINHIKIAPTLQSTNKPSKPASNQYFCQFDYNCFNSFTQLTFPHASDYLEFIHKCPRIMLE